MKNSSFAAAVAAAATLLGALPVSPVDAQVRDSTRRDTLETIRVTESRSVGVTGGASAVVIRPEALRSSPAPSLEQALRESPFVLVRQNSRGEMELSMRGSDSRQAAVLLDGIPLSLGWDHRTDPSLIPVTGTESITIIRGLSSVLGGPNTLGGIIDVRHGDGRNESQLQGWGGAGIDHNASVVSTLGAGGKIAEFAGGALVLRGGFAYRNRPGVSLPQGALDPTAEDNLRTNSDLLQTDGFAMLRWNGSNGKAVGLTFTGFNAERGVPPEEHIEGPRLWRYPYHTRSVTALSLNSGAFTTPLGFATLEAGAGYNSGRLKIQTFENREYRNVTNEELGDERTLTARAQFSHSLPLASTLKVAYTSANVQYAETLSPAGAVDYRQRITSTGIEVESRAMGRTALTGGVVFDRSSTPLTGGRTPSQPDMTSTGWRAGITHDVNADWRLHASASERTRFPALRELYSGALNRFRPNPELRPETLLGFEAGVTVDRAFGPIPDATIQLTGFRHRLDDAVVRVTLSDPTRFMRINRDRIESQGVEMLAGMVFGQSPDRAVSLTGDALVQTIKVFDVTSGSALRRPENNPERRGMVELGVPLPLQLRGFLNSRLTGTQYCLNADTQDEMRVPGQAETGVALESRIAVRSAGIFRTLKVLAAVDNISNRVIYDQCGLPQPGRTFRVMFTLR